MVVGVVFFTDLRLKIYRLAVEGYNQRKIGSILCLSRQDVYYHIKFLVNQGYLFCKNPSESPKQYCSTDKTYSPYKESKKSGCGGRYEPSHGNVCRVHCIGYICDVVRDPVVDVRWENTFRNNGTSYFDKHWNTDLGRVTIRMISTKFGSKLVFWLPEKYLDKDQLNHWGKLEPRYVKVFYNEFQKRYDCVLGDLSRYQKPEFAFPEDSEFLFLADRYNMNTNGAWVDESEGSPEWETSDYCLAKAKIELPERLLRLEHNVDILMGSIKKIEDAMVRIESFFNQPVRPDDRRDVT